MCGVVVDVRCVAGCVVVGRVVVASTRWPFTLVSS